MSGYLRSSPGEILDDGTFAPCVAILPRCYGRAVVLVRVQGRGSDDE
jgi:hypothetical protein